MKIFMLIRARWPIYSSTVPSILVHNGEKHFLIWFLWFYFTYRVKVRDLHLINIKLAQYPIAIPMHEMVRVHLLCKTTTWESSDTFLLL